MKAMSGCTGGKLMNTTYQASVSLSLPLRPELPLLLRRCKSCGQSSESSQSHVAPMVGIPGIPASALRERFHSETESVALDRPSLHQVFQKCCHWADALVRSTHTHHYFITKWIILRLTQMNKHNPGIIP